MSYRLPDFVRESNAIEGIFRDPTQEEIDAHIKFLALPSIGIPDVVEFVDVIQPGAQLRRSADLNVRVGNHMPPRGGLHIPAKLVEILASVNNQIKSPFENHVDYETLHPFMDGNGRSGRAIWLWQMGGLEFIMNTEIGFLHQFYYQSLDATRKR